MWCRCERQVECVELEVSPEEVNAKLKNRESVKIVDVREPWEYATARIHGSVHIPMNEIPARAEAELEPGEHLVVICHHGVRSARVTSWLRERGYLNAQSLRGGIDMWSRTVDPGVPLY